MHADDEPYPGSDTKVLPKRKRIWSLKASNYYHAVSISVELTALTGSVLDAI